MKQDKKSSINSKIEITISLDKNILDEIRNESQNQELSINSKINSILSKYVKFYKQAEFFSCLFLPQSIHSKMIDEMDEQGLTNSLKNRNLDEIPLLFASQNIEMTLGNIIDPYLQKIFLWTGMYTGFKFYTDTEGYDCLLFEHKYNAKWSRVLASVFSDMLEKFLNIKTEKTKIFPSATILRIKK